MKRISILALIFLSPVAWGVCPNNWTQFHNSNMQRSNPCEMKLTTANVGNLVQKWFYPTGSWVRGTPAIAAGAVYIGSDDGNVYALKAGKKLWSYQTGLPISASPAVANGIVYAGSFNPRPKTPGALYALNTTTGALLWSYPGINVTASPVVANGVVYVSDGYLYALDAVTGSLLWTVDAGGVRSMPAVANGIVYIGGSSGAYSVEAFDAQTGSLVWSYHTDNNDIVDGSPAVANGIVYIGADNGYLYALDASTGVLLWSYLTGTGDAVWTSPAVANGVVYLCGGNGVVDALDATTGTLLWSSTIGGTTSPAWANGVLYVGGEVLVGYRWQPALFGLDASTGKLLVTRNVKGGINSSPSVAGGVVYFGADDNRVYAFGLK